MSKKQLVLQKKGLKGFAVIVYANLNKLEKSKKFMRFMDIVEALGITYAIIDESLFGDMNVLEKVYSNLSITYNTLVVTFVNRDTSETISVLMHSNDAGLAANVEAFMQSNNLNYTIKFLPNSEFKNKIYISGKLLNYINYFVPFVRWIGWFDKDYK